MVRMGVPIPVFTSKIIYYVQLQFEISNAKIRKHFQFWLGPYSNTFHVDLYKYILYLGLSW